MSASRPTGGLPFRPTLITLVVLVIALGAGGVGLSAFTTQQRVVNELWRDEAQHLAREATQRTLRFLEPAVPYVAQTRALAARGGVRLDDRDELLEYLRSALVANPSFTWASFAGADGRYLAAHRRDDGRIDGAVRTPRADGQTQLLELRAGDAGWRVEAERVGRYDPRERPWYRAAAARTDGRGEWVEPFLFATNRRPGFMYAAAQRGADNALQGVWAVEYEGSYLSDYLAEMRVGRTGRVYVVSGDGRVVGHPRREVTERSEGGGEEVIARAERHRDPMLAQAWRAYAQGGALAARAPRTLELGALLAMVEPFPGDGALDWYVVLAVPADEVFGDVKRESLRAALIALAVAALATVAGVVFSNRVSNALTDAADELERVGRFDVTPRELAALGSFVREVRTMGRATERMKASLRAFGRYVPKELVADLLATGQDAVLGGRKAELTMLFSDIEGFTSIAERMEPDALVEALGEYLEAMSGAVSAHGGTVDKFIGDAVMAFWGAPRDDREHALRACRGALAMRAALASLQERWRRAGRPEFRARIGLNTGEVLVGNIGAPERMNYTVMGDAVNLASRLEGLNKAYGTSILLGAATADLVRDALWLRRVDYVAVKGRAGAQAVYELRGERGVDAPSDDERRGVERYERALERYRARAFAEAAGLFLEARALLGGADRACDKLRERCLRFEAVPPAEDWDGATTMDEK